MEFRIQDCLGFPPFHGAIVEYQIQEVYFVESGILGFGIWKTAQGIRNPANDKNAAESSTSSTASKVWNPEFKAVLDSFTWADLYIALLIRDK